MSDSRIAKVQDRIDSSPFLRWLGLRIVSLEPQSVELEAFAAPTWANAPDGRTVHGGVLTSLLDTAAALALIGDGDGGAPTISLTVEFLRPVAVGETVRIQGRVTKPGRRIGFAEAHILNPAGKIAVGATGVFLAPATQEGVRRP